MLRLQGIVDRKCVTLTTSTRVMLLEYDVGSTFSEDDSRGAKRPVPNSKLLHILAHEQPRRICSHAGAFRNIANVPSLVERHLRAARGR